MALFNPPQISQRSVSVGLSLIAVAALVALLYYGRDFFVTLFISAVFAFILDPAVLFVMKLRVPRAVATAIVTVMGVIAVYLIGLMLWSQISTVTEDLPAYTARLSDLWAKANERLDAIEQRGIALVVPKSLRDQGEQIQEKPREVLKSRRRRTGQNVTPVPAVTPAPSIPEVRIHTEPKPFLTTIFNYAAGYLHVIVMASFVPFLVYFMLSWRDHLNESIMRLFPTEQRYIAGRTLAGISDSTRAYVLGNFLLWVSLSSASAIFFFFMGVPYWPLVGALSAFFSLLPYVGLPLSIVPPVLAAIAIPNRFKIVLTLIVVTACLNFFAMNFLYAKVVGRRVRLNPLVVTIALLFWGIVWGGIGLILAVPITAAIKTVCDNVESLEDYGRLLGDAAA